jgi:hypothetical protein
VFCMLSAEALSLICCCTCSVFTRYNGTAAAFNTAIGNK